MKLTKNSLGEYLLFSVNIILFQNVSWNYMGIRRNIPIINVKELRSTFDRLFAEQHGKRGKGEKERDKQLEREENEM